MKAQLVAVACIAILMAFPAAASESESYTDPDDTRRRLDIARLEHRVAGEGKRTRLVHVVEMYRAWTDRLFLSDRRGRQKGWLSLSFNTRGDHRSDWGLSVHHDSSGWVAELCSHPHENPGGGMHVDPICHRAKVRKPTARSIAISVRRSDLLARGEGSYGWRAYTRLDVKDGCPDGSGPACQDWAPGRPNYLRHSL